MSAVVSGPAAPAKRREGGPAEKTTGEFPVGGLSCHSDNFCMHGEHNRLNIRFLKISERDLATSTKTDVALTAIKSASLLLV